MQRNLATIRTQLSEQDFAEAWGTGEAMTVQDAIAATLHLRS
jgi:hypothetical protein